MSETQPWAGPSSLKGLSQGPSLTSSFRCWPAILGAAWLVGALLQPQGHLLPVSYLVCSAAVPKYRQLDGLKWTATASSNHVSAMNETSALIKEAPERA